MPIAPAPFDMILRWPLVVALLSLAAGAHLAADRPATPHLVPTHSAKVRASVAKVERGKISYYAGRFAGRATASGERFDPQGLTMAHPSLPLGTIVEVTNDDNGRRVRLRVNDRGPAVAGRVADVSLAAARQLGFVTAGITEATIAIVSLPFSREVA